MLFNALIIFGLCMSLSHALLPMNFETQTRVRLTLESQEPVSPCLCRNNQKCTVNFEFGDNVCLKILKQFEYSGSSNPNFLSCQIDPATCVNQKGSQPKAMYFNLVFDQYHLSVSGIWMGQNGLLKSIYSLFNRNMWPPHLTSELQIVQAKARIGKNAMPIEFTGVLNNSSLSAAKAEEYYYCHQSECIDFTANFVDKFINALRSGKHPFRKFINGYYIKRIYVVDGEARIDWALMFQYRKVLEYSKITKRRDLHTYTRHILDGIKLPSMLRSVKVYRAIPLDFCELYADGFTSTRYHSDFLNPLAKRTRVLTEQYYNEFIKQITTGDNKCPTCFRSANGMYFENGGTYAKIHMNIWVSGSCFRKRGVKTCEQVAKVFQDQWKKGDNIIHNPIVPRYNIKYQRSGLILDE